MIQTVETEYGTIALDSGRDRINIWERELSGTWLHLGTVYVAIHNPLASTKKNAELELAYNNAAD